MELYEVLVEGDVIAGMRSPGKGGTLKLTAQQAEHPLRKGDIKPAETRRKAKK